MLVKNLFGFGCHIGYASHGPSFKKPPACIAQFIYCWNANLADNLLRRLEAFLKGPPAISKGGKQVPVLVKHLNLEGPSETLGRLLMRDDLSVAAQPYLELCPNHAEFERPHSGYRRYRENSA